MSWKSETFDRSVWERDGADSMSRRWFITLFLVLTMIGLLLTTVTANWTINNWMIPEGPESSKLLYVGPINKLVLALGVLVLGVIGALMSGFSRNAAVSFAGYLLICIPFGVLLGPFVSKYDNDSVKRVLALTAMVVGSLALIGAVIPKSLEGFGGILFGLLIVLLIGQFGLPLAGMIFPGFPMEKALDLTDWFGIVLFSGYIIFDVNRAMHVPTTMDNCVDCAVAFYLDIINLYIRLQSQKGSSR